MTAAAENGGKLWTAQEDERLRELAGSGATLSEIAEKLNRTSYMWVLPFGSIGAPCRLGA